MHCGNCTQHNALYVHTLFPLGQQADVPVPPGKAARAMLIWPQRDVPCREIASLQLGYASFSDETSSSPSTAARIRCFACTPASCASWQIWVCCMYSMFCFTAWYIICATCASVRHWRCFTGHMQSFSQLRTAQRKWLLAVWGRYFVSALCKILCEAETVHVQRHTYNYPSLICFAVGGMCSVPSSSACRRAASYSTLMILWAHL